MVWAYFLRHVGSTIFLIQCCVDFVLGNKIKQIIYVHFDMRIAQSPTFFWLIGIALYYIRIYHLVCRVVMKTFPQTTILQYTKAV